MISKWLKNLIWVSVVIIVMVAAYSWFFRPHYDHKKDVGAYNAAQAAKKEAANLRFGDVSLMVDPGPGVQISTVCQTSYGAVDNDETSMESPSSTRSAILLPRTPSKTSSAFFALSGDRNTKASVRLVLQQRGRTVEEKVKYADLDRNGRREFCVYIEPPSSQKSKGRIIMEPV